MRALAEQLVMNRQRHGLGLFYAILQHVSRRRRCVARVIGELRLRQEEAGEVRGARLPRARHGGRRSALGRATRSQVERLKWFGIEFLDMIKTVVIVRDFVVVGEIVGAQNYVTGF